MLLAQLSLLLRLQIFLALIFFKDCFTEMEGSCLPFISWEPPIFSPSLAINDLIKHKLSAAHKQTKVRGRDFSTLGFLSEC